MRDGSANHVGETWRDAMLCVITSQVNDAEWLMEMSTTSAAAKVDVSSESERSSLLVMSLNLADRVTMLQWTSPRCSDFFSQ